MSAPNESNKAKPDESNTVDTPAPFRETEATLAEHPGLTKEQSADIPSA